MSIDGHCSNFRRCGGGHGNHIVTGVMALGIAISNPGIMMGGHKLNFHILRLGEQFRDE